MPSLSPADRAALKIGEQTDWPCAVCGQPTFRGYCREHDEFYTYGCRCPNPHAGHRTYEPGNPTFDNLLP